MSAPNLVCIDTETGGLDPATCALLSVSLMYLSTDMGGRTTLDLFILPEPGKTISPEATKVNGYTPELWAQRKAVTLGVAMLTIAKWLPYRCDPLAHNASFDKGFIETAEREAKVKLGLGYRWRCSMGAMMAVDDALGLNFPNYKLDTLAAACGHWGPGYQRGDHQASADVEACAVGYRWLMEKIRGGAVKTATAGAES